MNEIASAVKAPTLAPYENLKRIFAHTQSLFHIKSILGQDMMTVMPRGGTAQRIEDISNLTKRVYAETINNKTKDCLLKAEEALQTQPDSWSEWDRQNLKEMRWIYDNMAATPPELFVSSIHAANEGRVHYFEALRNNDWETIKPWLKKVLELQRHILGRKQELFKTKSLYETALFLFMRDANEDKIMGMLDRLAVPLRQIGDDILEQQKTKTPPKPLTGNYPRSEQMDVNCTLLEKFGFDFNRGTLTITRHGPTAGGHGDEARILVRCEDHEHFMRSIEDTLYYGAKGLYMQGLPQSWMNQPVGKTPGTLMLEANSILIETIIGRTPQFFTYLVKLATEKYPHWASESFEVENLYQLRKIVKTTALRQDADELTRFFHDLMRTRIERDLINGDLGVDELPERWRAESLELLHLEPENMAEGLLQSPNWFIGNFGTSPLFILSYIAAAQIQDKIFGDVKDFAGSIARGEFGEIAGWLKNNIYDKARSRLSFELIREVTGQELHEEFLLSHLKRRYLSARG